MVICKLPSNAKNTHVNAVSLIIRRCEPPPNIIDLVDLRVRRRLRRFHLRRGVDLDASPSSRRPDFVGTVDDDDHDNKDAVVDFTVCVPPMFDKGISAQQFVEFVEVNRMFGAGRFVFYIESIDDDLEYCITRYADNGLVELVPWHFDNALDLKYHGQIIAINDCLYRTMYRTRYVVGHDADEFIVPTSTDTWPEMLARIHSADNSTANRTASYSFRNLFFPLQTADDDAFPQRRDLRTLAKTTTDVQVFPHEVRSKTMARPERILLWHVHLILDSSLVWTGDVNCRVDADDGMLFHYREINVTLASKPNRRMHHLAEKIIAGVDAGMELCRKSAFHVLKKWFS